MKPVVWQLLLTVAIFGAQGVGAAPLNEIAERLGTRPVAAVEFENTLNLSPRELLQSTELRVGQSISLGDLERAVSRLFERGVFDDIGVEILERGEGPAVKFILVPRPAVTAVEIVGGGSLDTKELKRRSGVRIGTGVSPDLLEHGRTELVRACEEGGYYGCVVEVSVQKRSGFAQVTVVFRVEEGDRYRLHGIEIEGIVPPDVKAPLEEVRSQWEGEVASERNAVEILADLRAAIRGEGYLQASVHRGGREVDREALGVKLRFRLVPRGPLTVFFTGNRRFTAAELFEPLQLRERSVPFSPNAIQSLSEQIRAMYQREGYYWAEVSPSFAGEREGRRYYTIRIDEGEPAVLREIVFVGNRILTDSELSAAMKTSVAGPGFFKRWFPPGYLVEEDLAADIGRIKEMYRTRGYHAAEVTYHLSAERRSRSAKVIIDIVEGEPLRIEELLVEEERPVELPPLQLQVGERMDGQRIEEERGRLERYLQREGYPGARVEEMREGGLLRFRVLPGPRVRVGRIVLSGNRVTHDEVILRELQVRTGDWWNSELVARSADSLLRLGIFSRADIQARDGVFDSEVETLAAAVEERDTGSIQLEATLNTEEGLHLVGEIRQRNYQGRGDLASVAVDGYLREHLLDAGRMRTLYAMRDVFGSPFDLLSEGFAEYSVTTLTPFDYNRVGLALALERQLGDELSLRVGERVFRQNIFDVDPALILGERDTGSAFYSLLIGELALDRRDNRFLPRSGYVLRGGPELSAEALGSEVNYWGGALEAAMYRPLGDRLVWLTGVRGAFYRGFGDTEVLPLYRRLFLGGRESLRGFSRNQVGPRYEHGPVVGGDASIAVTSEMQYDLTESVAALVFLDVGQAFLTEEGFFTGNTNDLNDLRFSPGVGAQYKTPIGPITFEVGIALDREEGERPGRFLLGIGSAF